jgi:YHYH protein
MPEEPIDQTPQPLGNPDQPGTSLQPPVSAPEPKSHKRLFIIAGVAVLVLLAGAFGWRHFYHHPAQSIAATMTTQSQSSQKATQSTSSAKVQGLQLDTNKNYGNKYSDGVLPVGDGKYTSSGPKKGYVYACTDYARNLAATAGGAGRPGPWFTDNDKEYNVNQKLHVLGSVMWQADFSNNLSGGTRTIVTNDLPNHHTGIFPIMASDPAYAYDKNPNSIEGQTFTYKLAADPSYNSNPNCEGGEVGIMLTGVALFSALDAGGRDAGAWEVQDSCDGHPQSDGIYHYHTLSSCIKNISVHTVIGYALDGFPITGPDVGTNNMLTTSDLDECHGIVSQINLDGKNVTMYHYVMTQDYPYSVSCYRAKPISPPGQAEQQQSMQTGQGASVRQQPPPRP